jgi:hypothetical protein
MQPSRRDQAAALERLSQLTGVKQQSQLTDLEKLERLTVVKRPEPISAPGVPSQPDRGNAGVDRTTREPSVSRGLPGQSTPSPIDRALGEPNYGHPPLRPADHDRDKERTPGKDDRSNRTSGSGRSR